MSCEILSHRPTIARLPLTLQAKPCLYWLPLSDADVAAKSERKRQAEAAQSARKRSASRD